jgi:HEAT repeat protein
MIAIAEFRDLIAPAFPGLVELLKDSDPDIRRAGADALSQFFDQGSPIYPFF